MTDQGERWRQSLTRKGTDSYPVRLYLSCFPAQVSVDRPERIETSRRLLDLDLL